LPIGFDPGGADAWSWQSLLATRCTMGAPPDVFNTAGQDWQLPPFVPHKLREAGYEPFIQTIRAALRHAGGLRIDHVMGLFRLYWIPEGFGPQRGGYVRYRADEALAIVALESHRAGAFVVGEDLGTVEPEVRQRLAEHQVLSFRLLWFEKQPAERFPRLAMAAATTHDLPTVAGLWTGRDMEEQRAQGHSDAALVELRAHLAQLIDKPDTTLPADAIEATYRLLGRAPSLVLVATLEDALGVTLRPNVPGTTTERPNWSLGLPGGLEALERSPLPRRIAGALTRGKNVE
jgi:4-alpha-glucanotransferase